MSLAISGPRAKSNMFFVGVGYQPHLYCSEQHAVINVINCIQNRKIMVSSMVPCEPLPVVILYLRTCTL